MRLGQRFPLRTDFQASLQHVAHESCTLLFSSSSFMLLSKSIIIIKFVSFLNHILTILFVGHVPCSFLVLVPINTHLSLLRHQSLKVTHKCRPWMLLFE